MTRITLTEIGGGNVYLNPNDIVLVTEQDEGLQLTLRFGSEIFEVIVKESVEELADLIEALSNTQEAFNDEREALARKKAEERYLAYQQSVEASSGE